MVNYPGAGLNTAWVQAFVSATNSHRTEALSEDPGLDAFAMQRFQTAVSEYGISDYGFDSQSQSFFAGTGRISTEEILYPKTFAPSEFISYLQKYAPGHWSGLVDRGYTKFGYYLGTGPVIEFGSNCPVTEIIGRNVNITQLAISNGCQYSTDNEIWLLLILSS
jgi:hypothetical protein